MGKGLILKTTGFFPLLITLPILLPILLNFSILMILIFSCFPFFLDLVVIYTNRDRNIKRKINDAE